jgi:hypothetical protein
MQHIHEHCAAALGTMQEKRRKIKDYTAGNITQYIHKYIPRDSPVPQSASMIGTRRTILVPQENHIGSWFFAISVRAVWPAVRGTLQRKIIHIFSPELVMGAGRPASPPALCQWLRHTSTVHAAHMM